MKMFSNRPTTLIYLDPPYLMERQHSYDVDDNTTVFHEKLLRSGKTSRSMMLISAYDTDLYNEILGKDRNWSKVEMNAYKGGTDGVDLACNEIIWMNHRCRQARMKQRVPIRLHENEKRCKKVNSPRAR